MFSQKANIASILIVTFVLAYALSPLGISTQKRSPTFGSIVPQSGQYVVKDDYLWKYTSPQGMVENSGYDSYAKDGLTFKIYGWKYSASVSDSSNTLSITPINGGAAPSDMSKGQQISLVWTLTPMSVLFSNSITWPSGKDTGLTVYHLLENGVLDVYYANAPSGVSFQLSSTSAPTQVSSSIYQTGSIRIRVVVGSVSLSGNTIAISPSSGTLQFIVYSRNIFDNAQIDELGALKNPSPGEVVESSGFAKEKSLRIQISKINLDKYIAIDPQTPVDKGMLIRDGAMYVTDSSGSTDGGWAAMQFVASIAKSGALTFRDFAYSFGNVFGSQTFNFYLNTPRGTMTFWSVGRITQPYSIYYYPNTDVHVFYFPETQVDGAEDGFMTNTITTKVVYAFQDSTKTMITAENFKANADLYHTSVSGNSVDPGWRHYLLAPSDVTAILTHSGTWSTINSPRNSGSYTYSSGDAGYVVGAYSRYFLMKRLWRGYWESAQDLLPSYISFSTNNYIFGFMKGVSGITPAGSTITVNHVVKLDSTSDIPSYSDAQAAYQKFSIQSPTVDGMIDLSNSDANTNADWDIGSYQNEPRIFYMSSTPPTTTITTATTTATPAPPSFSSNSFAASHITGGYSISLNYTNTYPIGISVRFSVANSTGDVVYYSASEAPRSFGGIRIQLNCTALGTGNYSVRWVSFFSPDAEYTFPLSWSKSNEIRHISC